MKKIQDYFSSKEVSTPKKVVVGALAFVGIAGVAYGVYELLKPEEARPLPIDDEDKPNANTGPIVYEQMIAIQRALKVELARYIDEVESVARSMLNKSGSQYSQQSVQSLVLNNPQLLEKRYAIEDAVCRAHGHSREQVAANIAKHYKTDRVVQEIQEYIKASLERASQGLPVDLIGKIDEYANEISRDRVLELYRKVAVAQCAKLQRSLQRMGRGDRTTGAVKDLDKVRDNVLTKEGFDKYPDPPSRLFLRLITYYEQADANSSGSGSPSPFTAKLKALQRKRTEISVRVQSRVDDVIDFEIEF